MTLHALGLIFLIVVVIMMIARASSGEWLNALADLIGALVIAFALWLSAKGHFRVATLMTAYSLTGLCFLLAITKLLPPTAIMPQLALCMAIFTFIIESRRSRIVYLLCAVTMLTITNLNLLHPAMNLGFAIQMGGCAFVFHCFVALIERQEQSLKSSVANLQEALQETAETNETLSARNEELHALSHIMSHDLKSPLAAIRSSADLLLEREFLGYIRDSADTMTILINDILHHSQITRSGELELQEVDLDDIFEQVVSMFRLQLVQQEVIVERAELPCIKGHAETLCTVFQNLISNAIKYQPQDESHHPRIRIWSEETETEARVFFSDNGIGIEEAFQPHLFLPFRREGRGEYQGTGLGMSICKHIVESHEGRIGLWSSNEHGSTFVITFPRLKKADEEMEIRYGRPEDPQPIDLDSFGPIPELQSASAF